MVLIFFSLMTNNMSYFFFKQKSLENGLPFACSSFFMYFFLQGIEIFYIFRKTYLICISDTVYKYVVSFLLRVTFKEKS